MNLSKLKALCDAANATAFNEADYAHVQAARQQIIRLTPAMIECIEAADAMRGIHADCWPKNETERQAAWDSRQAYDLARAAIEDAP